MNTQIVTLLCVALAAVFAVDAAHLTGSLKDTMRIVGRVCHRPDIVDEAVVRDFFSCYDKAPGKAEFLRCQVKELGQTLDTLANLRKTCLGLERFPGYARCLKVEMDASGVDQADAVSKVNACQGIALKFEQ